MKSLLVSLDLEMNQPSGRIIQIGAVVGHVGTGNVIDRFDAKVDPVEPLDPQILVLTGLNAAALAAAPRLEQAYAALLDWLAPHARDRQLSPLTWGGGDTLALRTQLGERAARWPFGRRWIDAKTVFVAWRIARGEDVDGGLAAAMRALGIEFSGHEHDALADAENTFTLFRRLLAEFRAADVKWPAR